MERHWCGLIARERPPGRRPDARSRRVFTDRAAPAWTAPGQVTEWGGPTTECAAVGPPRAALPCPALPCPALPCPALPPEAYGSPRGPGPIAALRRLQDG
ncbi:hypothetical protein SAVCW2_06000 [Streptomyces avermitilis]|uniref:Uncharacterized protein n=1 Tax=Streptomyces avermitilis TaxID=33903 RepID=A0A4D4MKU1_STRAX|nr:hypothetical protein SAVMC3_81200 [Streptomyces avermitilis]GDY72255.1 hypothetical protein SAV31267_017400 [Streptomyces avermitilis]GDY81401.1 hypothetical protein SAVCW2_06000 [Streptomyces avermitilis]